MTIDEAIKLEKKEQIKCENDMEQYNTKLCKKVLVECAEYHKQLAEWLEKLKTVENIMLIYNANYYADEDDGVPDCEVLESIWNVIQDNGLDIDIEQDYRKGKSDGYNKAIDDFVKAIIFELKNRYTDMPIVDIFGSREKWKEKNSRYLEFENLAYKIAEQLKEKNNEDNI